MRWLAFSVLLLVFVCMPTTRAAGVEPVFSKSGEGPGPSMDAKTIRLLTGSGKEVNSFILPAMAAHSVTSFELRTTVTFDAGGEGFGILFLNADVVGKESDVQTVEQWEEPNRLDAIGIGFDTSNPPSTDAFDADGNIYDRPQREVSAHVDGREIFNRQSADFATGQPVPLFVRVQFVPGGALLTVRIGETAVYENELLAGVRPFSPRVAIGARSEGAVKLALGDLTTRAGPAVGAAWPTPVRVTLFEKTNVSVSTTREPTALVDFSDVPAETARVIATIRLSEPAGGMDKWDRRGALYLYTPDRQRYEIVRFKTPFAREWEWKTDVTDFLPLFKEQRKFGLFIDTWRDGFDMTVTLDFYEGPLTRKPISVVNLWQGEPILGDAKLPVDPFFDEKTVIVPNDANAAKVRVMATGHGQFPNSKNAAEFMGLNRALSVNGQTFTNLLWRTDGYLNPCRPQKGTWKYDRAGWAPGSITLPWTLDLTPIISKSRELALDYTITDDYVNEHVGKGDPPTHWIDSQVIFYSDSTLPAPTSRPVGPAVRAPATTSPNTSPANKSPANTTPAN
jgi:Peptide-N-glycosidase F, C terminal/Peptide-N-glycosidase F, N terminal